jgi:hypothetical protein
MSLVLPSSTESAFKYVVQHLTVVLAVFFLLETEALMNT